MADNQTTLVIGAEDRTAAAFRSIKSNMDALQNRMETFRNVAASIGGIYVVSGLANMVRHSLEAVDAVGKLAQKTGIATEELSALSYAAKLSDVSTESLSKGIKTLSQRMTEAVDPASKVAKIMSALGVDTTKGAAASIDTIANSFAKLPDGATKAALAVELFGKAGTDMIPLLNQGADGIKKMKDEAERFGLIVNDQAAKAAEAFNDNMKALTSGSQKLGIEIVNQLGPAMVRITNAMKDAAAEGGLLKAAIVGIGGVIAELAMGSKVAAMTRNLVDAQAELARIEQNATSNPVALALRGRRIKELQDEIDQWKRLIEQEQYAIELQRKRAAIQPPKPDRALESQIRSLLGGPQVTVGAQLLIDLQKQYEKLSNEVIQAETEHATLLELTKESYKGINAEIRAQIVAKAQQIDQLKREIETRKFLDTEHTKELEYAKTRGEQLADLANSWADATAEMEQEARLLGLSNVDRQKAILLEKARLDIIAAGDNAAAIRDINANLEAQLGLLDQINAKQQALDIWNQISDSAGRFFSDLVMNGRSAFDNLKSALKSFAAELVALFAKRWVLQMVASATGSTALSAAASQAGQGSLAGSLLNAGLGASGIGMGTLAEFFAGATGSFMGPAAAGSAASMGASFAAFMTNPATLAVLAAVVIAVAVMSRRGGPKEGGSFYGTFDAQGNRTGEGAVPGFGRFYTPSGSDQTARDIGDAMGSSFATALRRFGGSSAGVGFGIGFDRDPRGTAPSRVSTLVTDATGRVVYQNVNREAGRSEEDLQAALKEEASRALLAALQASELPQAIADILASLDPYTASADEIDAALAAAQKIADIINALAALDMPGIDIDVLRAFQQDGEALDQTLSRIAGLWGRYVDLFTTDAERLQQAQDLVTRTFADLGIAVPDSMQAFKDLVAGLDLTTEAGRTMWETLMQVAPAFAAVQDGAARAAEAQREATRQMLEDAGISAEALAVVIRDGLLGRISEEEVGARMAEMVVGGVYNALANTYAAQITQIMLDGIITPMVTAATTGATISAAASQASIDAMVEQVTALTEAFAELLNNPAFKEAMDRLREAIASVAGNIGTVGRYVPPPTDTTRFNTGYTPSDDSASRILNERLGLERRLLELEGNTAELRRRELEALDPSNRALQERIWALEEEQKRTAERLGLEQRLYQVQGDTAKLRELELAALDPSNRALQEHIWQLEDEAKAAAKAAEILRQRTDLEIRALEITGRTAEAVRLRREQEINAADESLRPLMRHVFALEDEAAAADKAVAAMQEIVGNIDALRNASQGLRDTMQQLRESMPGYDIGGARQAAVRDAYTQFAAITDSTPVAERIRRAQAYAEAIQRNHDFGMQALQQRAEIERQAYDADLAARREAADAANALTRAYKGLADFAKELMIGPASPLTGAQRLAELQAQYGAALAGARAGNLEAIGNLPGLASSRLDAARAGSATLVDYQRQALTIQREIADLGERGNRDLVTVTESGFQISAGLQEEMNDLTRETIDQLASIDEVLQGWIADQQAALEEQGRIFASINEGIVEMVLNTRGLDQRIADAILRGRTYTPNYGLPDSQDNDTATFDTPAGVSASMSRSSSDPAATTEEVKAMREELNAALIAVAQNTSKTARVLSRWEGDGIPETRVIA